MLMNALTVNSPIISNQRQDYQIKATLDIYRKKLYRGRTGKICHVKINQRGPKCLFLCQKPNFRTQCYQ